MTWKDQLKDSFTCTSELLKYLHLDHALHAQQEGNTFSFLVPRFFASLMKKNDRNDPLLKQVLPSIDELDESFGGQADPLDEKSFMVSEAVMQKFQSRVLVILSGHCAINCRYCFRRNFPYQDHQISLLKMQKQLLALENKKDIFEVIFSGGDPLTLPNKSLEKLIETIDTLENIKVIRFHTRMPVVMPDRVDKQIIEIFKSSKKKILLVIHMNHRNELSPQLAERVQSLHQVNVTVYNQAVLLKGVNDTFDSQYSLWKESYLHNIKPYYLHQLDEVSGGNHFKVSLERGCELIKALRSSLPGYMIPRYVQEVPHAPSKVPIEI